MDHSSAGVVGKRPLGPMRCLTAIALIGVLSAVCVVTRVAGQEYFQHGFEGRDTLWLKGRTDANPKETAHRIVTDTAYTGQRSEYIQFTAEVGNYIHYTYEPGRAAVVDELNVSVFVKANRPGAQLLCRIVLPEERDPQNLGQPMTVTVKGDAFDRTGRWQQLVLRQPVKRLKEQQQLLQAELKRAINIDKAYVDLIILNLYSGPGQTDVWTDDLEIGPLEPKAGNTTPKAVVNGEKTSLPLLAARTILKSSNQLYFDDHKFFMRAVRHTGTPLKTLRDAGFNTVFLDETTPQGVIDDAVRLGFLIIPSIRPPTMVTRDSGPLQATLTSSTQAFGQKVGQFVSNENILAWELGSNLTAEQFAAVARTAELYGQTKPKRPVCCDVWDGFERYSRGLDQVMLGMHRWPLMTGLELLKYRDWLTEHRRMAVPDTYCWTWIQTHLPDWYINLVYGKPSGDAFDEPIGPQIEQIRLLTYTAVGCGLRGVGFWSDRFLADNYAGKERLLGLSLLNQELEMLEPLLVTATDPFWVETSNPNVKAAVLRTEKAILVLPIWMGPGAQFVPGQSAAAEVNFIIPQVPAGSHVWEVSPGEVRSLSGSWERVLGGVRISVREFSLTAAIVLTTDLSANGPIVRFQEMHRRLVPLAAQWAHDLAKEEFAKVEKIEAELELLDQKPADAHELLEKARGYLEACDRLKADGNASERYAEAQRALRPLRILMRSQWERAVRQMDSAVSSPYALSFYTLPRHWKFWQRLKETKPSPNVLTDGDFELAPERVPQGWLVEEVPSLDDVEATARRVNYEHHDGKQCLMLKLTQKNKLPQPPLLERTFIAVHSPTVKLPPGTLVRITAWIKVNEPQRATTDGALIFDNIGGEAMAVRITAPTPWRRYTVYREVPASGEVRLTVGLSGLGAAFFDDFKIEPLIAADAPTTRATAIR